MSEDNSNVVFVGQTPVLPVEKKWSAGESIWVDGLSILGAGTQMNPFRVNTENFVSFEDVQALMKPFPVMSKADFVFITTTEGPEETAFINPGQSLVVEIDSPYVFEITQILSAVTYRNQLGQTDYAGESLDDLTQGADFYSGLWIRIYAHQRYMVLDAGRSHLTPTAGRQEGLLAEVFGGFRGGNPINCLAMHKDSTFGYYFGNIHTANNFSDATGFGETGRGYLDPNDPTLWLPRVRSMDAESNATEGMNYNLSHGYYLLGSSAAIITEPAPGEGFPGGGGVPTFAATQMQNWMPRKIYAHIKNVGTERLSMVRVGIEMLYKADKRAYYSGVEAT